jgi:hypothetical protein
MTTTIEYTSSDGKYRAGHNQVAFTRVGDTDVSTIWWKQDGRGGDWFETVTFRGGKALDPRPETYGSEVAATAGHARTVAALVEAVPS